jgi:hypothetical protein
MSTIDTSAGKETKKLTQNLRKQHYKKSRKLKDESTVILSFDWKRIRKTVGGGRRCVISSAPDIVLPLIRKFSSIKKSCYNFCKRLVL